jgi:replicative DNA helicase
VSLEYPRQVTLSLAKVLGYLVSEGYYNHKLTFTNFDQEVMNDYLENFSACFPNVSTDVAPSHREAAHSMTVEVQSFLEHIGFNKGLSKDRCVPLCIRTAPRHLVAAFLSALFEGDGYCLNDNRKQVWFTTTSRTLHDQVKVMLANLGILTLSSTAVKSATNGKPGNKSTAYNLIIGHKFVDAFAAEIGFVSSTKKKQLAGVLRRGASHSVGRKTEYLLGVSTVASAAYDYLLASGARAPNEATRGRLKQAKKRNRFTKMTIADVVSIAKTYHMSGSTPGFALLEALTDPTVYLDEVKSITSINEPTQVYDFVVPGTHSFSANGLMQHNTALELTLMTNMARLGYSPAMLQLELTETQISERLASNLGNIDSEIIRSGNINEKYQKRIIEASEEFHEELKVAKSRLTFFTPSSATIQECEYAFKTFKYDVWFIDYINLLKWEGGGKERSGEDWTRLSDIVKEFKRLAKKHGVAVVLAVQVNIDKDSGDIEIRYAKAMKEHADVVLVWNLDSNARKDGVVWLRHLKARQYEGFDFPIRVALNYCRFESVNMSQMPKVEERRLGSKGKIRREREEPKDDDVFQRKTKALPDTPSATKVPVAPEQDEDVLELVAKANKRAAIPLDDEEERYKELDDD